MIGSTDEWIFERFFNRKWKAKIENAKLLSRENNMLKRKGGEKAGSVS